MLYLAVGVQLCKERGAVKNKLSSQDRHVRGEECVAITKFNPDHAGEN